MSSGDNPTRSQAKALEVVEVVGERERHTGSSSAERGVGHDVSIELLDERDARIFDAPQLLGISLGIRKERPVHRQHERVHLRQRCRQRIGEVCRECGDAALARQVIAGGWRDSSPSSVGERIENACSLLNSHRDGRFVRLGRFIDGQEPVQVIGQIAQAHSCCIRQTLTAGWYQWDLHRPSDDQCRGNDRSRLCFQWIHDALVSLESESNEVPADGGVAFT